ncbi:hypothetical protein ACTFIZ_004870 [Dictyostelium cf. discoideum]
MFNFERIDHGSGKGTGIAIENRDTRKGNITINFKDNEGRILSIKYNSFQSINILLIYAPATITERNTFIINSKQLLKKHNSINHQIIAGDFNNNHDCNSFYGIQLRKIIDQNMLIDTGIEDNIPTFPRSMKRLDRIYCHPTLLNLNSKPIVHQTVFNKSDHYPITITIQNNRETPTTKTKLERLPWTLCKEMLNNKQIHDGLTEIITINKDKIKTAEEWISFKNQIIREYLKKEQNKLKKEKNKRKYIIHKLLENKDITPKMRRELNDEIGKILEDERKSKAWDIKIKLHLHQETPSKYLTSILKSRSKDKSIFQINDKDNKTISDKEGIAKRFAEFYQDQYDEKEDNEVTHKKLLEGWKVDLDLIKELEIDRPIRIHEVAKAIKTSSIHKSPGLDGINALFYRYHINSIARILTIVFNDLLLNKKEVPSKFKEGVITTIFKKGDELNIANRRPITLLNTDYKILSKVLNSRLLDITSKIINKFQNGFVPNRFIQDNIQIMKEVIEISNKRKNNTLITFYDFNKAFDSISHKSITRTLEHIGIPTKFIIILQNLLHETKNKIKINDFVVNGITIRRGTKQGDPISPTIFALVLEPLLIDIIKDKTITGFALPNSKTLKLTAFADDIATFTNSTQELKKINYKIQEYCLGTSSSLNKDKTVMIAIGDKPHDLPFQESTIPERYLGLNFTKKGLNSKFNTLIQEMKNNLIKWKTQAITLKAKMSILKTYVLSKLTYHQYIDELNEEQIEEINNMSRWFLFSSVKNTYTEERKYRTMMKMDRAFADWREGGIKLWDIKLRHTAFKIWYMNRLLNNNYNNNNNTLQEWYMEQLNRKTAYTPTLNVMCRHWVEFRAKFYQNHPKITETPDGLRNDKDELLKLKEIYDLLIKEKFPSPRRTEWQKQWALRYNTAIPKVFININTISHQKGRNTMFRFFSRSLPGINYERDTRCRICGYLFRDPYSHLFTQCQDILVIEKTIITTVNKLYFIKIHRWSMETLDISSYNRTERVFPNLIGIIVHQIWKIICYKLFNTDESITIPIFEHKIIEKELLNLIEIEKFITLKKIKHDEAILNNNNKDLYKYQFNKAWQTPAVPNPLPL